MEGNINEMILEKIEKSNYEVPLKKFIKEMIGLEIQNISGESHKKLYDSKLKHYSKKYTGNTGVDDED